ncbi:MAG TPA: monovalent cation/H+ antiporter subunit D [Steroidobacteraceae bacterium]|jgi:multicomponent K+:H+ antiporter subunit D|nr:monovalent cation/H+ antiporter subunit D [Steroidobacteraceae bacterium]
MNALLRHIVVLPVLLPLLAGTLMFFVAEARRSLRISIALASVLAQLAAGAALLYLTSDAAPWIWPEGVGVYPVGGWPAPFGIVLVVDRLAAVMVTLTGIVSLSALVYSATRWDRPGQPFHSLLQFLTMGLNGAFLTGDLFNLFVFFEVLLAASYGLMLRGGGTERIRLGLHYVAVNLTGSVLFLVGVALIYGMTGTLNMADLAGRAAMLDPHERGLFDAGAAVLGIAFLIKAGSWPLNFWLPGTYSIAIAPVGALFAMMTKVGLYAILRLGTILEEYETLGAALFFIGLASLATGAIGMLGAKHLARLVGYSVLVSTGILLSALGLRIEALTAPILFYLVVSAITTCLFFLLTGMTDRTRQADPALFASDDEEPAPVYAAYGIKAPSVEGGDGDVGVAIPAVMAFLGMVFACCALLVTGLPPLPGFLAKFSLLATALAATPAGAAPKEVWLLAVAVLGSGLAGLIALSRVGMRLFWSVAARQTPRLRLLEAAPVGMLVLLAGGLALFAGPVNTYLDAAARSLHRPDAYLHAVLSLETRREAPAEPAP